MGYHGSWSKPIPRTAPCLWLPDYYAKCRGRTNPSQGHACDPHDCRGARCVDACARGGSQGLQRPLPEDALKIIVRGAGKEDTVAA
jgi:hypothetical protein